MARDSPTTLQPASYLSKIQGLMAERPNIKWSLESKGSRLTQVAYTNTEEDYPITSPEDLIAKAADLEESQELSICIIENISMEYVEAIGAEWGIDPTFFIEHATNPDKDNLWWSTRCDWSLPDHSTSDSSDGSREPYFLKGSSGHLDGVFEYHNEIMGLKPAALEKLSPSPNLIHRYIFKDKHWPMQSNTRISYCRPNMWMCK